VGQDAPNDSLEAELPEETADAEEDPERLEMEWIDCRKKIILPYLSEGRAPEKHIF
jgi:hypothetical protein